MGRMLKREPCRSPIRPRIIRTGCSVAVSHRTTCGGSKCPIAKSGLSIALSPPARPRWRDGSPPRRRILSLGVVSGVYGVIGIGSSIGALASGGGPPLLALFGQSVQNRKRRRSTSIPALCKGYNRPSRLRTLAAGTPARLLRRRPRYSRPSRPWPPTAPRPSASRGGVIPPAYYF